MSSRAKNYKSEEEVCVPETHIHVLHLQLVPIHYDAPKLTVILLSLRCGGKVVVALDTTLTLTHLLILSSSSVTVLRR